MVLALYSCLYEVFSVPLFSTFLEALIDLLINFHGALFIDFAVWIAGLGPFSFR